MTAGGRDSSSPHPGTVAVMRNRAGIETRERILEATRTLLSERGLDGTTVKAICDAAGILAGSFYNLFDSKEEVVLSVVTEAIAAVDPVGEGPETVTELVEAYVRFVTEQQTLARVYLAVAVSKGLQDPEMARRVLRHHEQRVERFRRALEAEGVGPAEAALRAEAVAATLEGFALHALLDPSFDLAGHALRLVAEAVGA